MGPSDTEGTREEREGKKCRRGDEWDSDPTEDTRGEAQGGNDGKCLSNIPEQKWEFRDGKRQGGR